MERKKPTTIHDIAKALNLNSSTVSRALNNHPRISEKTRLMVQKTAKKLAYQPNSMAANLRKSSSKTIGVVIPRISRHFFSQAISGIEETAYAEGYSVVICQSMENEKREIRNIDTLISSRVDGILISPAIGTKSYKHLNQIKERDIPLFFFDRYIEEVDASKILTDDFKIARQLAQHLIDQGCKKMAVITGDRQASIYRDRINGIYETLKENGFNMESQLLIKETELIYENGEQAIREWLKQGVEFDAVLGLSDMVAISALKVLQEEGIKVPEDVMVAGFSNEPASALISPAITTVGQPAYEIGQLAVKKLLHFLKEENPMDAHEIAILKSELIIRESTIRTK
ncbi:LacI family DNA-binding transcriptional regulator [Limibacter armeniacum]|uniref:LacI family DNA-binding transcriptional regulator n=1 Tax=Limibacter armeniacum TaxID=466084 RepID=UPI002FE5B2FE